MPPKIASSVVETGPNDSLAAVDAYSATPDAKVDTLVSTDKLANNATNVLQSVSVDPKDIVDAIVFDDGSPELSSTKVADAIRKSTISNLKADQRINRAAGQSLGSIPGLDSDVATIASGLFPDVLSGETGELFDELGDVIRIGQKTDTESASSLIKAIKKLTGLDSIKDYIDNSAVIATSLAYLDKSVELGIPSMIDKLMEKYGKDKCHKEQLIKNVRSLITRSDMGSLESIIRWIGAEGVLVKVPDAIPLLLASYRIPNKTKPSSYASLRSELLSILTSINPNWDKAPVNGVLVSDLSPFSRISKDAKTLLMMSEGYDVVLAIAKSYPTIDINRLISRDFRRYRYRI